MNRFHDKGGEKIGVRGGTGKAVLILFLVASQPAWPASPRFQLVPDPIGLTDQEFVNASALLAQVEARLPPSFKERMPKRILVAFGSREDSPAPSSKVGAFFSALGRAISNVFSSKAESASDVVHLDRGLLAANASPELNVSNPAASTGAVGPVVPAVPSVEAVGSLIHRLSRKFDSEVKSISERPEFETLTGWQKTGFVFKNRSQTNTYKDRSPDPAEFASPHDAFAVNMERFLTDPEFACRRPTIHRYLADEFGFEPAFQEDQGSCDGKVSLPVSSQYSGAAPAIFRIDPKRVYQIQYLQAGEGEELQSRWGHAMLRIIVCAPERKSPGPDCLKDEPYHLVAAYRGFVHGSEGPKVNPVSGLRGDYPSRMFVLPFNEIKKQYREGEFRDLVALPLKLNRSEVENCVGRVGEQSWQYSGRYYFLGNNCATEALNLLKGCLASRPGVEDLYARTPQGLYDELVDSGLADASMQENPRAAEEEGYLFPSRKADFELEFENIKSVIPEIPYKGVDDMMARSSAKERRELWQEAKTRMRRASDDDRFEMVSTAFAALEDLALTRGVDQINKKGGDALLKQAGQGKQVLEKTMRTAGISPDTPAAISAIAVGAQGYGIPTDCEIMGKGLSSDGTMADDQIARLKAAIQESQAILEALVSRELRSEVAETQRNIDEISGDIVAYAAKMMARQPRLPQPASEH